ncbi:hypothetical protein BH11CYA1_BH11CYA1_00500 [soil metagenome]
MSAGIDRKLGAICTITLLNAFALPVEPQLHEELKAKLEPNQAPNLEPSPERKQSVSIEEKLRADLLEQEHKQPVDAEMLAEARLALAKFLIDRNKYAAVLRKLGKEKKAQAVEKQATTEFPGSERQTAQ